jgi:hypothetical protein
VLHYGMPARNLSRVKRDARTFGHRATDDLVKLQPNQAPAWCPPLLAAARRGAFLHSRLWPAFQCAAWQAVWGWMRVQWGWNRERDEQQITDVGQTSGLPHHTQLNRQRLTRNPRSSLTEQ